jgi:hypothetical protein
MSRLTPWAWSASSRSWRYSSRLASATGSSTPVECRRDGWPSSRPRGRRTLSWRSATVRLIAVLAFDRQQGSSVATAQIRAFRMGAVRPGDAPAGPTKKRAPRLRRDADDYLATLRTSTPEPYARASARAHASEKRFAGRRGPRRGTRKSHACRADAAAMAGALKMANSRGGLERWLCPALVWCAGRRASRKSRRARNCSPGSWTSARLLWRGEADVDVEAAVGAGPRGEAS